MDCNRCSIVPCVRAHCCGNSLRIQISAHSSSTLSPVSCTGAGWPQIHRQTRLKNRITPPPDTDYTDTARLSRRAHTADQIRRNPVQPTRPDPADAASHPVAAGHSSPSRPTICRRRRSNTASVHCRTVDTRTDRRHPDTATSQFSRPSGSRRGHREENRRNGVG